MVTTIHGFSSDRILPMYKPFEDRVHYVAISEADRHPSLNYAATIHHGIRLDEFPFDAEGSDDLLFFGRMHPDKGAAEAIHVALATGRRLDLYGIVQDQGYFDREVAPHVDGERIRYHGPVGGEERLRALGKAKALLHLINFDEPFGLSVIEAMACGTPVIAIDRGAMPELIDAGETGILVEIGRRGDHGAGADRRDRPRRLPPRRSRRTSRSRRWLTNISRSTRQVLARRG